MNQTRTAVITGASTGIGAALSLRLAGEGWTVIGLARRGTRLEELAASVSGAGKIVPLVVDLSTLHGPIVAVKRIAQITRQVELLANIAGVWHDDSHAFYGPKLWELPEEQIIKVMNVGIVAPMLLTSGILPLMFAATDAHVINLSGKFSYGGGSWIHYFTSKRALEQFTAALADETRETGVRVSCVSPDDTATEAFVKYYPEDAEDAMSAEEVVDVIMRLYSGEIAETKGGVIELPLKV